MTRLLREPLVHFLVLGAGLFALFAVVGERAADAPERIVVGPGQIEHLAIGFARTWQRPPSARELDGLIDDYVRDEVLYREAAALGLDRDDVVVRRRMRQKMEFLTEEAESPPPTEAELAAYLRQHAARFRVEPRVAFRQVYVSRDRRGAAADADARALRARLERAGPAADVTTAGDRLALPSEVPLSAPAEIARAFGDGFAAALDGLPVGRWAGPIESGYGLHLVLVRERAPGRAPALAEARADVEREWRAARRRRMVEDAYQRLRRRYMVVIERPVAGAASAAADEVAAR